MTGLSAEQSIQSGNLADALTRLQSTIRDDPSNPSKRIFLFQLLCVKGDWERALTQLNVAAELDNNALLMAQTYRELLLCEGFRTQVFEGKRAPLVFGEPPPWIGLMVQALGLSAAGNGAGAKALVDEAFEKVATRSGTIDDQEFDWMSDADMRIGPIIEAIINGKYYWVPIGAIAEMSLSAPEDLRDLVWLPTEFKWTNEGSSPGFIPSRYPGKDTLSDDQTALGRKTDWVDLGDDFFTGVGQKMFTTNEADYPILQTRHIVFDGETSG